MAWCWCNATESKPQNVVRNTMRILLKITLLLLFISCKTMKNNILENSNVVEKKKNDNLNSRILVIQNEKSKSVIFQSEYAKEFNKSDSTQYVFFDIDKETAKYIEENLQAEYCKTLQEWSNKLYDYMIEDAKQNNYISTAEEVQREKDDSKNDCEINSYELEYYDKQMMGINDLNGNKAIYIQLLDLRNDKLNLKNSLEDHLIVGYHGWFESKHRKSIIFLIEEKKFVMEFDDK